MYWQNIYNLLKDFLFSLLGNRFLSKGTLFVFHHTTHNGSRGGKTGHPLPWNRAFECIKYKSIESFVEVKHAQIDKFDENW